MGQQLTFKLEKGGGDRANLLATRGKRQRELLDAAAIRGVGVELDLVSDLALQHKRKKEEEAKQSESERKEKAKKYQTLQFLKDNIGRTEEEGSIANREEKLSSEEPKGDADEDEDEFGIAIESDDEFADMTADERRVRFSAYYKKEMLRQKALLLQSEGMNGGSGTNNHAAIVSDNGEDIEDGEHVAWEDG
jgi:hypothetical protein